MIVLFVVSSFNFIAGAQVAMMQPNVDLQPIWGPVGYDHVDYYYLPDIDVYFDVTRQQYVYNDGNNWITAPTLPPRYDGYDIYHSYKAVINEPTPWMHNEKFKAQYARYKRRHDQKIIRESHENKYRANPKHPEHNQWHEDREQHLNADPHGGESPR